MKLNVFSKNISVAFLVIAASLVIVGCAIKLNDFDAMPSNLDKLPLKVALVMDSRFRNYEHVTNGAATLLMGEGLSKGSEKALKKAFKEVVVVSGIDDAAKHNVDAIIIPELVSTEDTQLYPPRNEIRIICKWTISSADGKIYYTNTVSGIGGDSSFVAVTRLSDTMTNAAKDMLEKFITHMYSTKWWQRA
ncbi:hypothetical protein MNBD_GAMMA13-1590 [hydrothermal vent metagenome]|uniref:Lipoprotein n=1 Tax=hydrothermal vent metagenome TaxID=652676 RepID=A0A3B0YEW9_9ZZZZ